MRIIDIYYSSPYDIVKVSERLYVHFRKKFAAACDAIHTHSETIIRDRKVLLRTEKKSDRDVDFLDILLTAKVMYIYLRNMWNNKVTVGLVNFRV